MPQSGEYSLYFHIPFCTRKCDYCHFYVIPARESHKNLFLQSLQREWTLKSPLMPSESPISIYFGGGTPSLLSSKTIKHILSWISPSPLCEITLEANPESVSLQKMQDFRSAGINRISLGVQSFDDHLLKILSRTHCAHQSMTAIAAIKAAGFDNLSIDLMYDIPGQTHSSWIDTLNQAASLPISHLSLYNLTIEPHTVFFKKREHFKQPDSEASLHMLQMALNILKSHHFNRYEISAFSRHGRRSCHNVGYWTGRSYLGFGPSACSYWNQCRFRNTAHLHKYAKTLELHKNPIEFSECLEPKEQIKENLCIGLRLLEGVQIQQWPEEIVKGIKKLQAFDLLEKKESRLRLTEKGLLFHDTVAEWIMSF
jgi:oxygen-independent coproporphyrinogen III oxidase